MKCDHSRRRLVEIATHLTLVGVFVSTLAAPRAVSAQSADRDPASAGRNAAWLKVALASGTAAGGLLGFAHAKQGDAELAYLSYRTATGAADAVLFRDQAERAESWQRKLEWATIGAGSVAVIALVLYAVSAEGPGPADPDAEEWAFRGPDFIRVTSTARAPLQIMLLLRF